MDMGIKFEWVGDNGVYECLLHKVSLGRVRPTRLLRGVSTERIQAEFGDKQAGHNKICTSYTEAEAWVEEQARAWLAEVSREQRLLTLANAFSEAYAKAMADQGNTQAWLKVHEAWCAYDDARKEVTD